MSRPANDEMIRGFMDGHDLTSPEPSENRSAIYRHGFMCGRLDKGQGKWTVSNDELRARADAAMDEDEAS